MCELIKSEEMNSKVKNKFSIKKILRKQMRSLSILEKHENIESIDLKINTNSQYLLIGNAGLMCDVSYEQLFNILSIYGNIIDILLIPQKPYSLIKFENESEALLARNELNSNFCEQLNRQLTVAFISDKVWDQVFNNNKQTIDYYYSLFNELPKGLICIKDVINCEEENELLLIISNMFINSNENKSHMKNRLVKHFGFEFNYLTNKIIDKPIEPIPHQIQLILNRLLQQKVIQQIPDQLTINNYSPGHGIPSHTDTHSMCENSIISLSIGSDIVMQFKNPDNNIQSNVFLPQRSLLIMTDESRYLWSHGIIPSKSDIIISNKTNRLTLIHRKTRISLTFRKVKRTQCKCNFEKYCDSRKQSNDKKEMDLNESDIKMSNNLENKYVHEVYDSISDHFSETRYKPWPKVVNFLNSLPKGSLVLDVGCGNGKYINVNQNILMIGCDRSQQLLNICRQRNYETFLSDCLQLSVRNAFDACICIAVLHHLSSNERRIKALQSIIDLLSIGGKALIYVWAFEQEKGGKTSLYLKKSNDSFDSKVNEFECDLNICVHQNGTQFKGQDLFVPWNTSKNNKSDKLLRYYHVFIEGELEKLVNMLCNSKLLDIYYDEGNWCAIIQRI